jgi:ABC-2 type transport system permease protein
MPRVTIRLAGGGQTIVGSSAEEAYGEVEYSYGGRSAKSRSTSHREVLPILYELAERPIPMPIVGEEYPGYPLVAEAQMALPWFFAALPLSIALAWWWISRPPRIPVFLTQDGDSL